MEHNADQATLERLGLCLSMVAHEVRNILTPVRTQCELALRDVTDERSKQALSSAARRATEAADAMQAILDVAAGKRGSDQADLHEVVSAAVGTLPTAELQSHVMNDVPRGTWCRGDSTVLRLALSNLMKNALEAGQAATTVRVCAHSTVGQIHLQITDDGPGLPHATASDPFRAFQRSSTGGTGLGLSIAAHLLRSSGAGINLAATGASGTTWQLTLPIAASASPRAA
ncbi:MAG: HAMP domain-containing sensor histidine kinase [Phycisphaerales bacterium]